ncbi:hypothetical protein VNO80_16908 [Phaseolus coccineus]|uniref:Uncharacterized protein n=1 Tax=Phaseolus coccineus TaxID=3886 RepID=A0AAN9MSI4_PHACN
MCHALRRRIEEKERSKRRASEPSELSCSPIPSIIQLFSPKFQNPSFPTRAFTHSRLVISRPFKRQVASKVQFIL